MLLVFWMAKQFNLKSCKDSLKATRKNWTSWSLQLPDTLIIKLKNDLVGTANFIQKKNRHSSSTTFNNIVFAATFPRKDWSLLRQRTPAEPSTNAVLLPTNAAFIFGRIKSKISFVIVWSQFRLWKKTTFTDAEKVGNEPRKPAQWFHQPQWENHEKKLGIVTQTRYNNVLIGIYLWIQVYIHRGTTPKIHMTPKANATTRFRNITKCLLPLPPHRENPSETSRNNTASNITRASVTLQGRTSSSSKEQPQ